MRIIFLDIDGVLNTHYSCERYGIDYIDSGLVEILRGIIIATNAKIVISSTWRLDDRDLSLIMYSLKYNRLEFLDCTPYLKNKTRSEEIKLWLKNNSQVEKYAILDDDADAGIDLQESFFQVDYNTGLTFDLAKKVIDHFLN